MSAGPRYHRIPRSARRFDTATFIGQLIGTWIGLMINAWLVMLLIGAAHSADERVPAIGFTVALIIVVVLKIAAPTPPTPRGAS